MSNLKFVSLVILELLAFNAQNLRGHVTMSPPPFGRNFSGVMSGLPWEHSMYAKFEVRIFSHFGAISI